MQLFHQIDGLDVESLSIRSLTGNFILKRPSRVLSVNSLFIFVELEGAIVFEKLDWSSTVKLLLAHVLSVGRIFVFCRNILRHKVD